MHNHLLTTPTSTPTLIIFIVPLSAFFRDMLIIGPCLLLYTIIIALPFGLFNA
jgi:hypothetical protein